MSNKKPTEIIEGLDDEARLDLLEYLAAEFGYNLTDAADSQDVIDAVEEVIGSLQKDLATLKVQFAAGGVPEYAELERVAENIGFAIAGLSDAHENLHAVIDAEFDVESD